MGNTIHYLDLSLKSRASVLLP